MLVLSRKRYQALRIGDNVTITVVGFRGDRVLIGIEAPKETAVRRGETLQLAAVEAASQRGGAT